MDFLIHPQTKKQAESFIKLPSHALAIRGDQGAGKGSVAKFIVAGVLHAPIEKISEHPYVYIIEAKNSKIGIDEVRALQTFLKLKVPGGSAIKRAAILENIDYLRHEAQNALLKTLEEPPEDTIILTTFSQRSRVLQTIHSRMQQVSVLPVELEYGQDILSGQFNKDSINKAYYMSGGQPGLMMAILNDQQSHELVSAISDARRIIEMSRYERLSIVDKLTKDKNAKPELLLEGLYRLISAAYKNSLASSATKTTESSKLYINRLKALESSINDLQENVQAKLVFSRLFMEL